MYDSKPVPLIFDSSEDIVEINLYYLLQARHPPSPWETTHALCSICIRSWGRLHLTYVRPLANRFLELFSLGAIHMDYSKRGRRSRVLHAKWPFLSFAPAKAFPHGSLDEALSA